ncbi:MAG: inositol monophosphatase family protein [bacterium]|nr:inositol monophosphatase family protein [bacterium]
MKNIASRGELLEYQKLAKTIALENGKTMIKYENFAKKLPKGFSYLNEYVANLMESQTKKRISKKYPKHNLFKCGGNSKKDFEWICDYIDGAGSYSKGHKISVTSVALTYQNETIVSVVYNPWTKTTYSAYKGGGFYLNGSLQKQIKSNFHARKLINVEWWPKADYDVDSWLHQFSMKTGLYVLHIGSVIHAACLVASGTLSGSTLGKFMSGKNHEVAAIKLILEEAGCILTDLGGREISHVGDIFGLLFAQKEMHGLMLKDYENFSKK